MLTKEPQLSEITIAGQQEHAGRPFPVVVQCRTPGNLYRSLELLTRLRTPLLGRLAQVGAILFRGFPLVTPLDFDAFVAAFDLPNFPYDESLSNAVRINKTPRVFTANEAPPSVTIFLHHEMAQTPIYPSKLFFFCEQPAETGGETPLCRSDILWQRLVVAVPKFARDCETKGLRYSSVMPSENDPKSGMGRSWQSTLRARTPPEAEERLGALGYTWQWEDGGCLRVTSPVLPAVRKLADGRATFFNQLIAAYHGWKDTRNDPSKAIRHGDDSPLDPAGAKAAAEIAESLTFDVPWQRGDVTLVDNYVVMHGRRTFTGTRKVLASLIAA